jgi:protein-tyrosine phosphatase
MIPPTQILDPVQEGEFLIRTDPHCHIIPGIDDGSPNIGMSLRMARRQASLGVKNIVATPHGNHPGIEVNTHPDYLRAEVAKLNKVFSDERIEINILPGTEVYLTRAVPGLLDRSELMTWADQGRHLLVELGFQEHSKDLLLLIDDIFSRNLVPIIAHPERYLWIDDEPEIYHELNERGCVMQFNTMSINGHFGLEIQRRAAWLIGKAKKMMVGTDSHHDAERYFEFDLARERVNRWGGNVSAPPND